MGRVDQAQLADVEIQHFGGGADFRFIADQDWFGEASPGSFADADQRIFGTRVHQCHTRHRQAAGLIKQALRAVGEDRGKEGMWGGHWCVLLSNSALFHQRQAGGTRGTGWSLRQEYF